MPDFDFFKKKAVTAWDRRLLVVYRLIFKVPVEVEVKNDRVVSQASVGKNCY